MMEPSKKSDSLTNDASTFASAAQYFRVNIQRSLDRNSVAVLPPTDVLDSLRIVKELDLAPKVIILDPWYNKGFGGVRDDYNQYILQLLGAAADLADHIFLWGFPEIIAYFVDKLPAPQRLVSWLTWYYKNNPSVIRGWRSSQNACLHMSKPGAKLYPEHFLNEVQKARMAEGKLRYIPGPTSVIEAALNIGFVGRKEQTGHPSQKPATVFESIIMMTTAEGDLVFDPMSGAGTTAVAAKRNGRRSIICDHSDEYTKLAETRLGIRRVNADEDSLSDDKHGRDNAIVEGNGDETDKIQGRGLIDQSMFPFGKGDRAQIAKKPRQKKSESA